uniref:Protein kinase domain-containing protein n=1 Tax=Fagus sylvatica TaxID=28930 RepID=A0A2N9I2L9_FAGSY
MVIETRGGAQIGVLEGNMQRLQQQVVDNTGSIDRLHLKVDGLEVGMAEIRAMMQEVLKRLPVVEQPAVQPRQEEQIPHRVQANLGEQIPITPPSIHRLPIGAEERNALSMRAPNHEVHFNPNQPRFSMPYDDPFKPRPKRLNGGVFLNPIVESLCGLGNARPPPSFEGQCGLYGEEFWREKRVPRQQQQFHTVGQQAQPQRHASQAREPRNAPWPQGDVVEPWYDHGGGRGNCGRAKNYQGPQDRDPYGKNQDPLQRQQGRQAREPRAMELEFPRFKGGDPTSWMFRAIQYFEYYQVHDASKVMHASYHLDDDALIWFQSCEHDLGCWDNFARAIQLRFGPPSYDDPMELLIKLKHVNSIEEYKGLFESLSNRIRNLSSMHKLSCFMSGLKDEVRLAIKMQGPRTLGEAYALAKIQEQYLDNVKRSTRPSYEANKDNWEQYSSQQVAAQFVAAQFDTKVAAQIDLKVAECDPKVAAQIVPKVAAQVDPKVTAQLDPKVAVQFDPKVAAQLNPKVVVQMDPKVVDPKPTSARPTMTVQKLTPKQMLERRRKSLCYNCDESWTMWHTCKAMKLYLIEEVQEEEGFADFRPYRQLFEGYLTHGLYLSLNQLDLNSFAWEEGPRLRMYLKLFPVNNTFNSSEVLRITGMFTGWQINRSDIFGPYELLNYTLLDIYKGVEITFSIDANHVEDRLDLGSFSAFTIVMLCSVGISTSSRSGLSKVSLVGIVLGTIVGAVTLSAVVTLLILRVHMRKHHAVSRRHHSSMTSIKIDGVKAFTYGEMALATNNFNSSAQVGQGGYGKVYKGILADGTVVAIKRAQEGSLQGEREFLTEIELLSRVHHRNLVSLAGYCDEEGEQMLVYEFMRNGTLRDHLSANKSKEPLSFAMRLKFALASAKGILYLHTEADPPIFHRDIKASNILLDFKYTTKVADFGLSRLAPVPDLEGTTPGHVSTVVKGTPCCEEEMDARPSMAEVTRELEGIWLMMPDFDIRTTDPMVMTPPSSSSMVKNPYAPSDVFGCELVSGVVPYNAPR